MPAKAAGTCGIAIMAKASAPGRTKTRLVPPLSFEEAAALNTAFLQDVADNLQLAGSYADIAGYVACSPSDPVGFFSRVLPPAIGLIDAGLSNLGDCLFRTIEAILARGNASAVVLNADSPTLPTAVLIETVEVLARPGDRAVLGPSIDGGYYLLGLKAAHHRMFEEIAWSTERVTMQTLERVREIKLDVHVLPLWYDIDDVEDLRRLQGELRQLPSSGRQLDPLEPHYPRHTTALLANLTTSDEFIRRLEDFMQHEPERIRAAP